MSPDLSIDVEYNETLKRREIIKQCCLDLDEKVKIAPDSTCSLYLNDAIETDWIIVKEIIEDEWCQKLYFSIDKTKIQSNDWRIRVFPWCELLYLWNIFEAWQWINIEPECWNILIEEVEDIKPSFKIWSNETYIYTRSPEFTPSLPTTWALVNLDTTAWYGIVSLNYVQDIPDPSSWIRIQTHNIEFIPVTCTLSNNGVLTEWNWTIQYWCMKVPKTWFYSLSSHLQAEINNWISERRTFIWVNSLDPDNIISDIKEPTWNAPLTAINPAPSRTDNEDWWLPEEKVTVWEVCSVQSQFLYEWDILYLWFRISTNVQTWPWVWSKWTFKVYNNAYWFENWNNNRWPSWVPTYLSGAWISNYDWKVRYDK